MLNIKRYENVLLSKRFSMDEKKLFLIGSISEFVISRDYFKSNSSIREYAQYYFDEVNEPLRDYLLDSRTILVARISKIIVATEKFEDIHKYINYHSEFLSKNISSEITTKKDKNPNSILDALLNKKENIR